MDGWLQCRFCIRVLQGSQNLVKHESRLHRTRKARTRLPEPGVVRLKELSVRLTAIDHSHQVQTRCPSTDTYTTADKETSDDDQEDQVMPRITIVHASSILDTSFNLSSEDYDNYEDLIIEEIEQDGLEEGHHGVHNIHNIHNVEETEILPLVTSDWLPSLVQSQPEPGPPSPQIQSNQSHGSNDIHEMTLAMLLDDTSFARDRRLCTKRRRLPKLRSNKSNNSNSTSTNTNTNTSGPHNPSQGSQCQVEVISQSQSHSAQPDGAAVQIVPILLFATIPAGNVNGQSIVLQQPLQNLFFANQPNAAPAKMKSPVFEKETLCICPNCGDLFETKKALAQHSFHVHNVHRDRDSSGSPPASFGCDICGVRYARLSSLDKHKQVHSQSSSVFTCKSCLKSYRSKVHFDKHTANAHKKTLSCEACKKRFYTPLELKRHAMSHASRSYNCRFCPDAFVSINGKKEHVAGVHWNEQQQAKDSNNVQMRGRWNQKMVPATSLIQHVQARDKDETTESAQRQPDLMSLDDLLDTPVNHDSYSHKFGQLKLFSDCSFETSTTATTVEFDEQVDIKYEHY